ncbi:hypothetical protein C8035_v006228 [Colletotrichum spinosum]|uniref:Uncharacterized protein n=1 Tax=Colletotrichum spinosum TaxID=1347390 RepID=A0A4R8Q419_9PEZI|nr:hypothetical protein C8035_v006228 [Colletotrichum spinosum]
MRAYALFGLLGLASAMPAAEISPRASSGSSVYSWPATPKPLEFTADNGKAKLTVTSLDLTYVQLEWHNDGDLDIEWKITDDAEPNRGRLIWQARPNKDNRGGKGSFPKSEGAFWLTTTVY